MGALNRSKGDCEPAMPFCEWIQFALAYTSVHVHIDADSLL